MKTLALLLLLVMLAGCVLGHVFEQRGAWAWVVAFCEAAAVGALADWFAVVALFRRPLGLPIPHTAILPHGKDRLADGLAVFVRDQFLAPDTLLEKLRLFDPASRLGQWLTQPAQSSMLAQMLRGWMQQALDLLDEAAVRRVIQRFVVERLRQWDAAASAGEVLALLTHDDRHQRLFDEALQKLGRWLDDERVKSRVSALIVRYARREWPKLISTMNWVTPVDELGDKLAERLAHAALDEMQEVLANPGHPLRADYETWLRNYIVRLREDPALAAQVEQIKQNAIDHPALQDYVQSLWGQIQHSLRQDLANPDSAIAAYLQRSLEGLGRALSEDPALRDALNQHMLDAASRLTERLRSSVTEHIAGTMKGWDQARLVDLLELSVGRDLQYIRFNGTLVGGLIGLALHALAVWLD